METNSPPPQSLPDNLWTERKDPVTGNSSIKTHELRVVKEWCKPEDHDFMYLTPASRVVRCRLCGYEATYIPGVRILVNGKLVQIDV